MILKIYIISSIAPNKKIQFKRIGWIVIKEFQSNIFIFEKYTINEVLAGMTKHVLRVARER